MTEQEYEEILRIVKNIQNSPAMNGAFDRLTSSVEEIKSTQDKMCGDVNVLIVHQKEGRKKLDEMHTAMYDPDNGLYRRINDSREIDKGQGNDIGRLKEKQTDLNDKLDHQDHRITEIESTHDNLKKVAGDRMENLDSVVKMDKNTKKLFWAGAAAVAAFVVKELGPAILTLL